VFRPEICVAMLKWQSPSLPHRLKHPLCVHKKVEMSRRGLTCLHPATQQLKLPRMRLEPDWLEQEAAEPPPPGGFPFPGGAPPGGVPPSPLMAMPLASPSPIARAIWAKKPVLGFVES
jgi:hypothetical protein